ncbi:cupin domain-containing protein [Cohnella panacarvi]|uniref:cupin domain-containing protein n=1 Tax=Cohnella panacarvi TaxID=400776 RepID=UPI00047B42C1|nr:cupin domain-containing protein [Cohnella panacarvi]
MNYQKKNVYEALMEKEISHEGMGVNEKNRLFSKVDFQSPLDFIDYVIVPPQSSIGVHRHGNNEEIYFIVNGAGNMVLGESEIQIKAGDVIVNPIGGTHGLMNNSDANISILVFQVSMQKGV